MEHSAKDDKLEAAIANYELAFRMQAAVPRTDRSSRRDGSFTGSYHLDDPDTVPGINALSPVASWNVASALSNCSVPIPAATDGTSTAI